MLLCVEILSDAHKMGITNLKSNSYSAPVKPKKPGLCHHETQSVYVLHVYLICVSPNKVVTTLTLTLIDSLAA